MGKDLKKLRKLYVKQGWKVTRTKGGHWRWLAPNGRGIVITASTTGARHSYAHAVSDLRRAERA